MNQSTYKPIVRRARGDEQKLVRRQAILDTAMEMFASSSYEAVTMADIANRLGLVKGTLYLYFETKEALFLALVEHEYIAWFDAIDTTLGELSEGQHAKDIASLLAKSLADRPSFVRLLAILSTTLEQNIDAESALQFKQLLRNRFTQTGELLETYLHFLKTGEGTQALLRIHALIIGLYHLAMPSATVQQVLQSPELQILQIDFSKELTKSIELLLLGMEADHS